MGLRFQLRPNGGALEICVCRPEHYFDNAYKIAAAEPFGTAADKMRL